MALGEERLKLLLDQGLPRSSAAVLRAAGIPTDHVADLGRQSDEDPTLVEFARETGACIVTLDSDFQAIVALSREPAPSIVWIRIQGLKAFQATTLIRELVQRFGAALTSGAFLTAYPDEVRVHLLPIAKRE